MQRLAHFLGYLWKNSAILIGFSVVSIALPVALNLFGRLLWMDWAFWFWILIFVNVLNLVITIFQYKRYIRFGR